MAAAIGMNARHNALGPGNRANATIGRAVRLVAVNILGARTGQLDGSFYCCHGVSLLMSSAGCGASGLPLVRG